MGTSRGIIAACVLALAACAPSVDGPRERQRAVDREDADRLAAQLRELPGTVSASVTLHRAHRDPLGATAPTPASGIALVVVDDAANRDQIAQLATAAFAATAPDVPDRVVQVVVGAHRPALASVGPFTVTEDSKPTLRIVLALALGLIALLAGWIAFRESQRRGNNDQ